MLDRVTARFDRLYSPTALAADRQPPAGIGALLRLLPEPVPRRASPRASCWSPSARSPTPCCRSSSAGSSACSPTTPAGRSSGATHGDDAAADARRRAAAAADLRRPTRWSATTRIDPEPRRPGALAEPLARDPPVLDLLPERLRRPHRQQGDAGGRGDRDGRQPDDRRGLVRGGLRRGRGRRARRHGPAAAGADRDLDGRLRAALRWTMPLVDPRLRGGVGGALGDDRADGRQLHQHPDAEDLRRRRRRGRLRRGVGDRRTSAPSAG